MVIGQSIDPDVAHSVWGCQRTELVDTDHERSCQICRIERNEDSQPLPSPSTILPTWMRLLTDFVPQKSIWGDKQLPVYAAVWSSNRQGLHATDGSSFTLDVVGLTASSVVDARQVQEDMINRVVEYYASLFMGLSQSKSKQSSSGIIKRLLWH
jgi:hypothetical protein